MNAPHGYHWSTIYTGRSLSLARSVVYDVNIAAVGQHVADTFSVSNRIFLTGDAAHTHSPKAGRSSSEPVASFTYTLCRARNEC